MTFFPTAAAFRAWLAEHAATEREVWVGFYKKGAGKSGITYPEAVDEALCAGWIDGVRRGLGAESYTNRFTPRKPGSNWSAVNIRRVGELRDLGRMHPAGLAAFERRTSDAGRQYSYENTRGLDGPYEARFRANAAAWAFFEAQPPSYRRVTSWWVLSAKREATRQRRLATLIADSERGERLAGLDRPPRAVPRTPPS